VQVVHSNGAVVEPMVVCVVEVVTKYCVTLSQVVHLAPQHWTHLKVSLISHCCLASMPSLGVTTLATGASKSLSDYTLVYTHKLL